MEKGVVSVVAESATSGNASGVEFEFEGMTKGAMEDWVEKYKVGFFFFFIAIQPLYLARKAFFLIYII